jgi:hypothetical protein
MGDGPVIIDGHGHLHPGQADLEDRDFDGTDEALRQQQRVLYAYHRPRAVTAAGETVPDAWKLLWDERRPSTWAGRTEVGFRTEGERFVWDKDAVTYSASVRLATEPAHLVALMDAVGVERAVLQASLPYNRCYGRVARAYRGRFLPVAYLKFEEDVASTVAALDAAVADGMVGVSQNPLPGWGGFDDFHTARLDPLWREADRRRAGLQDGMGVAGRRLRRHRRRRLHAQIGSGRVRAGGLGP